MTYLIIGIAAIVFGGILYLIYRKRRVGQPSGVSEEASETPRESAKTATATRGTAPPVATEFASKKTSETALQSQEGEKAMPPLVSELSSLPEDAKNKLMNAVWYRCENPYCNYTQFLDVHHVISEVEGGTNKLDNLIVLCPRCHLAADNYEIPEKELRFWIRERSKRFKSDLDWPYK